MTFFWKIAANVCVDYRLEVAFCSLVSLRVGNLESTKL